MTPYTNTRAHAHTHTHTHTHPAHAHRTPTHTHAQDSVCDAVGARPSLIVDRGPHPLPGWYLFPAPLPPGAHFLFY